MFSSYSLTDPDQGEGMTITRPGTQTEGHPREMIENPADLRVTGKRGQIDGQAEMTIIGTCKCFYLNDKEPE